MSEKITFSSELMPNYKQAEVVAPDAQFEALQTNEGHSLLFSIGTDNVFYLTRECVDHPTGWEKTDLSSSLSQYHNGLPVVAKTFAVSQSINNDNVDIALAITVAGQDYLYLAQNNSNSDISWSQSANWLIMPFDDKDHSFPKIDIVDIYIAQSHNGEYIVVDIIKNPDDSQKFVFRYYIDPTKKITGQIWNAHDLPANLEPDQIKSCLGKRSKERVEGIYTLGNIDNKLELIYTPLYNSFNPRVPANPVRLVTPPSASAIAVGGAADGNFTDLFVAGDKALYYFPYDQQQDGKNGIKVFENDIFLDVQKLFVHTTTSKVIVWGLNRAQEIFYTTCNKTDIQNLSAWSYPLALLNGVEQVTPYVNCINDGNTFFASIADNKLKKAVQSPETTIWKFQDITLPALNTTKALKFSSYTTQIQVSDADNQPIANATISLSAQTRTGFYINHSYYILDTTPIPIKTDKLGSITIVEWVDSLQCTQLIVTGSNRESIHINPMDTPFKKVAQLNTVDSLKSAKITNSDGSTKPLVGGSIKESDLQAVADINKNLFNAYSKLVSSSTSNSVAAMIVPEVTLASVSNDFGDAIVVAFGDLFNWLKSGVESVIQFIEDPATGVWHFIVTIAGKVYRAVIDTVETVMGAVEWAFNAIKTAIGYLVKFLEFLFEWDDIKRTKNVLKNLTKLFLDHQVDEIEGIKRDFDTMIASAQQAINRWAGIDDLPGLGSDGTATVNSKSTPSAGQSSPVSLLSYHFQNNAQNATQLKPPSPLEPPSNPIDVLMQALEKEGDTLGNALTTLQALAEKAPTMSVVDLFKALIGILADVVLESAKNVIDALFDILYDIAKAALQLFDTPIHIPVISDILSEIGISEFSFLDVACWVAAVPVTLGYKIAHNTDPFPDNDETSFLINVTNFQSVVSAFSGSTPLAMAATSVAGAPDRLGVPSSSAAGPIALSPSVSQAVFVVGHAVSGMCGLLSAVLDSAEAAAETGDNTFAFPSGVVAIVGAAGQGLANLLVPFDPIQQPAVQWINRGTVMVRVLAKIIFSGPAQSKFKGSPKLSRLSVVDGRGVGAIVDGVLVIPALFCSCWHFSELSQKPADRSRSIAIVDEISNVMSDLARLGYTVAVNSEAEVKVAAIVVMAVADVVCGGLQIAVSVI
ncbi:hypothetical protein QUA56_16270 [Microcoleus sp. N3A4]|uniref:hypothetical protein n=1 Tax=Microcoleus sp. N3A4 TaxID=3055379 RepID=UPI002FD35BB2